MSQPRTLEGLRIARPCPARWEEMAGDDRVRFCSLCQKNVYNLSALSREAAARLVEEKEGKLCALYYRRSDGTVLTSDCPVGARAFASRVVRRVVTLMTGLLFVFGYRELAPEFGEGGAEGRRDSSPAALTGGAQRLTQEEMERLRQLGYLAYADVEERGDRQPPEDRSTPPSASETTDADSDVEDGRT